MSHKIDLIKVRKSIIRQIYLAQVASDAGKGIYMLPEIEGSKFAKYTGYISKKSFIKDAMELCDKVPKAGIWYTVKNTYDQNGYPSILVYFTIKEKGTKNLQVSFHIPKNQCKMKNTEKQIRWTQKFQSRENCRKLFKEIKTLKNY